MKKFKEFLWFLIPFLGLICLFITYFILNSSNVATLLKLMLSDPIFIIALINTAGPLFIVSFIFALVYNIVIDFLIKKSFTKRQKYIPTFLVSIAASLCYIIIKSAIYNFILDAIFVLQIGIIVTFIFWIVDIIKEKKKVKKLRQKC